MLRRTLALGFVALAAGCSLLGNFETVRCNVDADCQTRGLTGFTCLRGNCERPTALADASTDADAGAPPECLTNGDCTASAGDAYRACVVGRCEDVTLKIGTTQHCGNPLGDKEAFRAEGTVVVGAFVENPLGSSLSEAAIALALSEINGAGGLPGADGKRRKLSVVPCTKARPELVAPAAKHLREVLRVPAILGQIETNELRSALQDNPRKTLFLATLTNERSLRDLADPLLWLATDDLRGTAPAINAVLSKIEDAILGQRPGPITVGLVASQAVAPRDLADDLAGSMRFNGDKLPTQNAGNYFRLDIPPRYTNPDTTYNIASITSGNPNPIPDVIVAIGGDEIASDIIPGVEKAWGGAPRPYWLVSQLTRFNASLPQAVADIKPAPNPAVATRFYGVDFGGDVAALSAFDGRLKETVKSGAREGFNVVYDAMYVLALAIAAVDPKVPLSGDVLSARMQRVVGGETHAVGKDTFAAAIDALSRGTIVVSGTSGNVSVEPTTRVRGNMGTSLYCIAKGTGGDIPRFNFYTKGVDPKLPKALQIFSVTLPPGVQPCVL